MFVAFEESEADIAANFAGFGVNLVDLQHANRLRIDHIEIDRSLVDATGAYDLEGLFIRLKSAIDAVGARRVAIDTIEVLFAGLGNPQLVRSELHRLFAWLKAQGITSIVTAERGTTTLTRHGIEEFVADCVIQLDHEVRDVYATRRLRVVKYRGSPHGVDPYPFLIDSAGISVLPITSVKLDYEASSERVGSGIDRLDTLLGGGVFRDSSVLLSGSPGGGKTSLAAAFAVAACQRGERALFLAFEEASSQIVRNMRSIGIDLDPWLRAGSLSIVSTRPSAWGLETHLLRIQRQLDQFKPDLVVLDPVSSILAEGSGGDSVAMLARLLDLAKRRSVTSVFTNLVRGGTTLLETPSMVSSMMDTWLVLRDIEADGERNRVIQIIKSRGNWHSNQVREVVLSEKGIDLIDVYMGAGGMRLGSARMTQEEEDRQGLQAEREAFQRRDRDRQRRRDQLEARILALRVEFGDVDDELEIAIDQERDRVAATGRATAARSDRRGEDEPDQGGATSDRSVGGTDPR